MAESHLGAPGGVVAAGVRAAWSQSGMLAGRWQEARASVSSRAEASGWPEACKQIKNRHMEAAAMEPTEEESAGGDAAASMDPVEENVARCGS